VAAGVAHLPAPVAAGNFYFAMCLTLVAGAWFTRTGQHDWLYGLLSVAVFPLSLAALISLFCLYVYEMPTHHCPFCMLQKEYHFVGYFLYAFLLVGAIAGRDDPSDPEAALLGVDAGLWPFHAASNLPHRLFRIYTHGLLNRRAT
jgi:hypothetical protein